MCDINTRAAGVVMGQAEIESQIQRARHKIEMCYVSKIKGYDNFDIEVREGIPYVEIQKFARVNAGNAFVTALHTRQLDPEKAVLGNTVQQVFFRFACPVTSVNYPDKVADL